MKLKGISEKGLQRIAKGERIAGKTASADALEYLGGEYDDTDGSFYAEMYDIVEDFPVPKTTQEAYHARDLAILVNQTVQKGYAAFMDYMNAPVPPVGAKVSQEESWLEHDPDEPSPYVFMKDQVPFEVQREIEEILDTIGDYYNGISDIFYSARHYKKPVDTDQVSEAFNQLAQASSSLVDILGSSFG